MSATKRKSAARLKPGEIVYKPHRRDSGKPRPGEGHRIASGAPFIIKRHLIHRVRSQWQHDRHRSAELWCGGTAFPDRPTATELTTIPEGGGRLLCEFCEAKAVKAGEKPTDTIVGHHVHTGRMVTRQTCHDEESQLN